jgi:hypothetical protein
VIPRRVAPFRFGRATGSLETWIRTCPQDPQPGRFTTAKGWRDPFRLLAEEDERGEIASVLAQAAIPAQWSGAAIVGADGGLIIEGRPGEGDAFMLGIALPDALPGSVVGDVTAVHESLSAGLGPVRIEWVHDGEIVWIVQLHVGATQTSATALVEGDACHWFAFEADRGLAELRSFLADLPDDAGLLLEGKVGLTSHVADVVRKWGRPARMAS